jgi:hypothetical protein
LRRLDHALLELVGRRLERVDLRGREAIAGALVPVDLAVERVEVETQVLDLLRPVHARIRSSRRIDQPPEECDDDEEPNPPRLVPDDEPIDRLVPKSASTRSRSIPRRSDACTRAVVVAAAAVLVLRGRRAVLGLVAQSARQSSRVA